LPATRTGNGYRLGSPEGWIGSLLRLGHQEHKLATATLVAVVVARDRIFDRLHARRSLQRSPDVKLAAGQVKVPALRPSS
jgi:hypothetical protein